MSQATIVIKPTKVDLNRTNVRPDHLVNLFTEREIVRSETVAATVAERVSGAPDPEQLLSNLTVDVVDGAQVLNVRYEGRNPEVSPLIAQAFASVYLEVRADDATAMVEARANELRQQMGDAQDDLEEANRQVSSSPEGSRALAAAQSRSDLLITEIQQLQESLNGVLALAVNPGTIITPASPAAVNSVLPSFVLLLVGGFIGFLVGTPVAFLRDRLDRKVRDASQLTRETGMEVLGKIPRYPLNGELDPRRGPEIVTFPNGAAAESYRRLCTTLAARTEAAGALAVAGLWTAKEGVANVAVNMAVSLAESGFETLLISTSFRDNSLDRILNLDSKCDLVDVLTSRCTVPEAMQTVPGLPPGLRVISAGVQSSATGDVYNLEALEIIIGNVEEAEYDFLIIDAPPVLAVADSLRLASSVDGVILVARTESTDMDDLTLARDELHAVGAEVIGTVLLGVQPKNVTGP